MTLRSMAMALLAFLPLSVQAAPGGRVETQLVKGGFVAEDSIIEPGKTSRIAFDMTIEEGWHTYWKNSGDSGEKIDVQWTLPEGVSIGEINWPAPHRQPIEPMMNYGYSDEVTLLMDLDVPQSWPPGKPVDVTANVTWLVCAQVCIPEQGETSFSLETGPTAVANTAATEVFDRAALSQPVASPYNARYQYDGTHLSLRFDGKGLDSKMLEDAYFFPSEWGVIDHPAIQIATSDPSGLTIVIPKSPENEPALEGPLSGILEITEKTEGGQTLTVALDVNASQGIVTSGAAGYKGGAGTDLTLPMALLFAFIGGIILNLMPCVFPVLALKAIGFAETAHESKGKRLAHGLSYTAGILTLFLILAGGLVLLKSAGAAVGWGFQLQNPLIVAGLSYLLLLVGLNLSGVFEVNATVSGGDEIANSGGNRGAFFTGALAAVVATPCTAPFMAAALGAALTMSTPATMAIFAVLGLGLAFPFLLLSVSPGIARRMPKPGVWMVRLKEFLAFPMYASAAWLLTVLGALSGTTAILSALMGAVLVGMAAWAFGVAQESGRKGQLLGYGTALASIAAVIVMTLQLGTAPAGGSASASSTHAGPHEPYSSARLAELRSSGEPVFINLTADWCITCKVNERMAFGEDFRDALKTNGVTYLVGDWTARDPEITALLDQFGRVGVPMYAVFPREGDPVLLPQILTSDRIVRALGEV